jgi:hypothetical protein
VPFVLSALSAVFVQAFAFEHDVTKCDDLRGLVRHDNEWNVSADHAARDSADEQGNTICSLRNNKKATWVLCSFWLQMAAIMLLSAAIGLELWRRLD